MVNHNAQMVELAKEHSLDPDYLQKLHFGNPHFKAKHDVNLANAKIHMKAKEVNNNLPLGERKNLLEIQYLNLTKEQEDDMKGEVLKARKLKRIGAHLSNKSAAQDYRTGIVKLNDMITGLSAHTGASIVALTSRSHLEDTFAPNWICSENASSFMTDTFGVTLWDGSCLLEQWSCAKSKNRNPDSLASMCIECSTIINGGLKTAAQSWQAQMNYANYDTQIIQKHGIMLIGWTFEKLISPNDIHTIHNICTLLEALRCGTCHWTQLSKLEITNHAKHMIAREQAREIIRKKRKACSDAGVKRDLCKVTKTTEDQATTSGRAVIMSKQKATVSALSQLPLTHSQSVGANSNSGNL